MKKEEKIEDKKIVSKPIIDKNNVKTIERMRNQIEAYDYNHQKLVKENNNLKYQIQEQKSLLDTIENMIKTWKGSIGK